MNANDRRREYLQTRTIPFLAVASGDVAVDLNGRYNLLQRGYSAIDGETLIQCPDARWNVDSLERALARNYEAAVARWS